MYRDYETVPPIVSEELWDKANKILHKRSEAMSGDNKTSYQNKYAYSGKIQCMEHNTSYHRTEFKYKNHSREAWRCKKYSEQGKSFCDSPTIYTDELNEIMRRLMDSLITDKAKIIHDMIKMYSDINAKSSLKSDIAKLKVEINNIIKMKDKLLDLNIKERIDDDEFESRNKKFNAEIEDLQERVADCEKQLVQNDDFMRTVEVLRSVIANELSFEEFIGDGVVDSLLDRIEVYKVQGEAGLPLAAQEQGQSPVAPKSKVEKNTVKLKVFLRVIDESTDFNVKRQRGKTSVIETVLCSELYEYSVPPPEA
jgi:hypothetical protein